jgi:hypothetical protein
MKCERCHITDFLDGARFCHECGAYIGPSGEETIPMFMNYRAFTATSPVYNTGTGAGPYLTPYGDTNLAGSSHAYRTWLYAAAAGGMLAIPYLYGRKKRLGGTQ